MSEHHDDLSEILGGGHEEPSGGGSGKKKKSPLARLVIITLLCLVLAGGIWAGLQFLEKGEVEVPLPPEVAKAVTENLRLEEGKLGPVKIVDGNKRAPEAQPRPANVVGQPVREDENRPSAGGLAAAPEQSAEALVVAAPPAPSVESRQKIYTGSDAVVTIGFVNDLAMYLADNYWPRGSHVAAGSGPTSTAGISGINQRYGIELTGFSASRSRGGKRDFFRERAMVLGYALTPSKINALTRLYADRFADQLAFMGKQQTRTINGKSERLDDAEVARMLRYYAHYGRALGAALLAYADSPEAPALLAGLQRAEEANYEATVNMHEARYAFELAEEEGKRAAVQEARALLSKSEKGYRESMIGLQKSREAIATLISKGEAETLDTESLVYTAAWAARRGPQAVPALRAAAESAKLVASVLEEEAEALEPSGEGQ